ncbi:YfhO family protein [Pediococcus ethanolidurans]|nr:YfhO family protein [Pediococcus ethanolidurans]MCV3326842.1 YfhO family protein [Pediococcus ethanolidurans]MCV3554143.1 YfhO family protein [Pediococcus ethanolidurans]
MQRSYLNHTKRLVSSHKQQLFASFLIPLILMSGYFIYRKMAPFGSSSLLTVDLGQQYVDLFAYFRHTILHDPTAFFYSFSKAIGGDMTGTWAYYLMSPFNLILLFFPGKTITSGIFIITVLKYAFSGLTFAILLQKMYPKASWLVPGLSTTYALMGFTVANQLNLIWLDAPILLPLIVLGIEQIFKTGKIRWFVLWLALMLIINYYMAYMICIFSVLYFAFASAHYYTSFKAAFTAFKKFVSGAILSAGFASWLLMPTFYILTQSKVQYTETSVKFKFEYFPFKMLSKLLPGTFNFEQMPSGLPNIFVGAFCLIGFILYFTNRNLKLRERITAGIITLFLLLSLCFQPLDLFWHAMQFPWWYPYRFSFLVCFWIIFLAARYLFSEPLFSTRSLIITTCIFLLGLVYLYLNLTSFKKYVDQSQFFIGCLFVALGLLAFILLKQRPNTAWLITILVILDVFVNACMSLNNLSYVSQSEFGNYTTELDKTISKIQKKDKSFYRIGKTYMRTKDDSMQAAFNGGSHFSSTFETQIPNFMQKIGQPDGDGFVTYSNGTLITDSLLGMKYWSKNIDSNQLGSSVTSTANPTLPALTYRPDLTSYQLVGQDSLTQTYKNPYALSIGFGTSSLVKKFNGSNLDTIQYQSQLYSTLAGKTTSKLFTSQNFNEVIFQNINQTTKLTGSVLKKNSLSKPGIVTFKFTPTTNDAYYLTLGQELNPDNATFTINGKTLTQYSPYRNTVVVNFANHSKGKTVTLRIQLKKMSLWLENFTLYHFNQTSFTKLHKQLSTSPLKVTKHNSHQISGNITVSKKNDFLMTTIPYGKGWHAQVDGKSAKIVKVAKTFCGIQLTPGTHKIVLTYWPPYLFFGLIVSLIALLIVICYLWFKKRSIKK